MLNINNTATHSHNTAIDFIDTAKTAILTEIDALHILINELDESFELACQAILACQGRVIVTGMGKSGHIGRKIAATLTSTGTPAYFMHPAEAAHGDLGMLAHSDVLIAISNSGESDEIRMLLPIIKQLQIQLISISRAKHGALPMAADIALTLGASTEACPLGLAPTSSTTATLALGDALAVALLYAKDFTSMDFAMSHPAGALGRKLLTRVADIMHTRNLPIVRPNTSLNHTLLVMTTGRLGLAIVIDDDSDDQIVGIFTDGDLRRNLTQNQALDTPIQSLMTKNPKTIKANTKAVDALKYMNNCSITHLLVSEDHKLLGVIGIHDLVQAGISD